MSADHAVPASVTVILDELRAGNRDALGALIPHVYGDLHRMAARRLRGRGSDTTLQPTALVHELYLRLAGAEELRFVSRAHFFAVAARAMRAILVDRLRAKGAAKRVPADALVTIDDLEVPDSRGVSVLLLDAILDRLKAHDPRIAHVVECRSFGGMTIEETAEALGVSIATVKRDWRFGRAWLIDQIAAAR